MAQELPITPNRQLIGSAHVKHLVGVELTSPEVPMHAEARQICCTKPCQRRIVQNVHSIGKTAGPREICQGIETLTKPVLIICLQSIVVAVSRKPGNGHCRK